MQSYKKKSTDIPKIIKEKVWKDKVDVVIELLLYEGQDKEENTLINITNNNIIIAS